MSDPSAEPLLDRPMFIFTDENGSVVLMEDDLARVLGLDSPEEAVGDPLAAALGLTPDDAERFLREIAERGSARHRLAEIWNRRSGRRMWVLLGGTAPAIAEGFIGADITVSPVTLSPPVEDLDHRTYLERMALMVRHRMSNGGRPPISEEKDLELRAYVAARLLALYVLIVRMAGRTVGETFENKIRQVSRARSWPIDIQGGRVDLGPDAIRAEAWKELDRLAVDYAMQVTSKRQVSVELAELDVNFGPATIQRAEHLGLRGEL
jgi:hypothetical protein